VMTSEKMDEFLGFLPVHRHITDVFDSEIASVIANGGKAFLYCDGGNKTKELAYFNECMKLGDVIGCHDYRTEVSPMLIDNYMEGRGFNKIPDEEFKDLKTLQMFWERLKDE